MKLPKLTKGEMVEIVWCDANIPIEPGWMSEQEHKEWAKAAGSGVRSVGIYILQDKDFISIVGDTESEECADISYLRPLNIAKGFIRSINILERQKKKKGVKI